jgi:aminocarboxymuconate-semialdehyde decarboxylase
MRIIDSHFHWWPRSVSERLCKRKNFPRAEINDRGGYTYLRQDGGDYILNSWAEWFDLEKQLEHMDGLGHDVVVVCSIGPLSVYFSDLPKEEGRGHRDPMERGDGGRAAKVSRPSLGERCGAVGGYPDRH